jgi:hypothetical protein
VQFEKMGPEHVQAVDACGSNSLSRAKRRLLNSHSQYDNSVHPVDCSSRLRVHTQQPQNLVCTADDQSALGGWSGSRASTTRVMDHARRSRVVLSGLQRQSTRSNSEISPMANPKPTDRAPADGSRETVDRELRRAPPNILDARSPKRAPGDEADPGTPGTGEDVCPQCRGSGMLDVEPCPNC